MANETLCYCAGVVEVWLILVRRGRHWLGCLLHLWLVEVSALPGLSCLCFTAAALLAGPLILLVEPTELPEHVLVRMAEVRVSGNAHVFLGPRFRKGTLILGPYSKKFTWLGSDLRGGT